MNGGGAKLRTVGTKTCGGEEYWYGGGGGCFSLRMIMAESVLDELSACIGGDWKGVMRLTSHAVLSNLWAAHWTRLDPVPAESEFELSAAYYAMLVVDTSTLFLARLCLFFACRRFLLRSLYSDLRHLSEEDTVTLSTVVELHDLQLPSPVAATPSNISSTERTWHSSLSRGTFSLCFSEGCMLFLLILAQSLNVFAPSSRLLNWKISLGLLLSAILLVAPLQQSFLFTSKSKQRPLLWKLTFTFVPYIVYLFILSHVPLPTGLRLSELEPLTSILARLVVLGTLILGIFAGFGAISAIYSYIQLSKATRESVSENEVQAAEQALARVRNDLTERQRIILQTQTSETQSQSSLLSRINPFGGDTEYSSLRKEIQGLEALVYQMSRNVEHLQQRRTTHLYTSTIRGRAWIWIGGAFALYCGFRVINSIINLLYPLSSSQAVSTPDLLASLITRILSPFLSISQSDVAAFSRQLSLLLVGAIIMSSVRRALRGVSRVLKVASKNLAASFLLLILAQLLGVYLLSTLIQLRTSFPSPTSLPDSDENQNLFSTLPEFHVFGPLFDSAFIGSVLVSGVTKWLDHRINGPGLY